MVRDYRRVDSFGSRLARDLVKNYGLYLLLVPALLFYTLFCYKPLYGAIIAFKRYVPTKGIVASPWVGLTHFEAFFGSYYFWRLLRNTLTISLSSLVIGFPAPIIFALLLNELRNERFKKIVQTVTYLPHFISMVVMCGLIRLFTQDTGVVVQALSLFGFEPVSLLFARGILCAGIRAVRRVAGIGWGSIIYLSALTGIDPELYEAGDHRWRQPLAANATRDLARHRADHHHHAAFAHG